MGNGISVNVVDTAVTAIAQNDVVPKTLKSATTPSDQFTLLERQAPNAIKLCQASSVSPYRVARSGKPVSKKSATALLPDIKKLLGSAKWNAFVKKSNLAGSLKQTTGADRVMITGNGFTSNIIQAETPLASIVMVDWRASDGNTLQFIVFPKKVRAGDGNKAAIIMWKDNGWATKSMKTSKAPGDFLRMYTKAAASYKGYRRQPISYRGVGNTGSTLGSKKAPMGQLFKQLDSDFTSKFRLMLRSVDKATPYLPQNGNVISATRTHYDLPSFEGSDVGTLTHYEIKTSCANITFLSRIVPNETSMQTILIDPKDSASKMMINLNKGDGKLSIQEMKAELLTGMKRFLLKKVEEDVTPSSVTEYSRTRK
jgi:hypothetical protein